MPTARIASVHFYELEATRAIYGGIYRIPPVALDADPIILKVEDRVQRDEGPVSSGPGAGRRQKLQYAVIGEEIARDLVGQWSQNGLGMTPDCHPGVWVVRDRLPVMEMKEGKEVPVMDVFSKQVFRPANSEESNFMWNEDLAAARRAGRAYAEWCYMDGNRIADDVRLIQFIPKQYKAAARHYGLEADWLKDSTAREIAPCPHCTTMISKRAMICPKCSEPIDLVRYAEWEIKKKAAMRDANKLAA